MLFAVSFVATVGLSFVLYRWAVATFPLLARHRRKAAVALVLFVFVAPPLVRWVVGFLHAGGTVQAVLLVLVMTLAIGALPIGVMHLAFAIGSRVVAARRNPLGPAETPAAGETMDRGMTRRQFAEATGGLALLGTTGSMLVWGAVRGRHAFELREIAVRIPGLPRVLDGYAIAQISDIHTGTYVGERELEEGLACVRAARADLVVVTGDIVDFDASFAPLVARKLGDLTPTDGVVAILGNHDYYAGAKSVTDSLRAAGVDVLVDAGRVVRGSDGGGFALLGVDDLRAKTHGRTGPRLDRALAAVPADRPRILLSHQPQTVELWRGQVALQLSGHTHGGQINPGFRPADLVLDYVAGAYEVGATTLYVNSGFGTVGPPSRVGAPPEVTRIVLVAV